MVVGPRKIVTGAEGSLYIQGLTEKLTKACQEILISGLSLGFISRPGCQEAGVELGTVIAIKVKKIVVLMALYVNRESVEAVRQGLIAQLLLPLSPLVIEDVVEGRDCVPLLPLV